MAWLIPELVEDRDARHRSGSEHETGPRKIPNLDTANLRAAKCDQM
jgi:hypothetical protein